MHKKILLSLICIIVLILSSGCVNKKKVLKTELDKRYNNYEIVESTHYWNTGGTNYVDSIVEINNNLYEVIVDLSDEKNEYYESPSEEINFSINTNSKVYSSNNNLILMKLNFNNSYTENQTRMLLFIENENNSEFYNSLYQVIEKINNEYKYRESNEYGIQNIFPSIDVYFTNNINYNKKDLYKKFLLLRQLAWNDTKLSEKLYKELNVNNYVNFYERFDQEISDRLNYIKQTIEELEESYNAGLVYDDYIYRRDYGEN